MTLRIANGAGFLGDWIDAPRRLIERTHVDYLTLEYLAELTLSILARLREKDPQAGYAHDFLEVLASLTHEITRQPQLKIVTNGGGMNPLACARAAAKILHEQALGDLKIGVVTGDDLLPRLSELRNAGCEFRHFDTNEPFPHWDRVVSVNAYLGAEGIAAALQQQARLVITGRVADASLTVGPCMAEFGTSWQAWSALAGYSVAGHLIECGAQVTGGYSVDWSQYDLRDVGYPIAEIEQDGSCIITKPTGSGGAVNRRTVTEQLVYEIGDPRHYLTPDVDCDFTTVHIAECGLDRVQIAHASGQPRPDDYKVSLAYRDGYFASGMLLVAGSDAVAKAEATSEIVRARLAFAGIVPERWHVEYLGAYGEHPQEIMLRLAMHDARREAVERFTRELAPLITSGPAGLAGYTAGRPNVRPVYAYWPTRIPKRFAPWQCQVRTAQEWTS